MHTIRQEAYVFLVDSYEKAVETFFDDPTEYADGSPLKEVFDELKKLGDELEVDILTLAVDDDLERLEKAIKKDENPFDDDDDWEDFWSSGESQSPSSGHMSMGGKWPPPYHPPSHYGQLTVDAQNKSIEEKLKKISEDRHSTDTMIGEWTTYDIEEEE